MGISGLLPLLKSVQKPTHLSDLAGKTIAVDAYVWLHRGAYACAPELVTGKDTTKYVDYAMYRIRLLQHYKITPYVVFDGGPLPAKKGTEVERKRKRDEHLVFANALAQQGKHAEAREHYVKCVDITPQMAFQLIKALRAENVSYVVAPYEADSQLAYLERIGVADGILTEDSDLLIFGAALVLFKLDASTATCMAISSDTLASNAPSDLALHGWGVTELRACAMLSGCDYLEGVRGIGLKTAGKVMRRWGTIERALRSLRMDGKHVERDWEQRMRTAEAAFLHQRVWDPRTETIVYLTDPDMTTWDKERERFVGRHIEPELAGRLARGDVDPNTLEAMVDIMPSFQPSTNPRPRPLALKDFNKCVNVPSANDSTPAKGSLFQYFAKQSKPAMFTPQLVSARPRLPSSAPARTLHVGGASGKRTLAKQYDLEAETPTKRPRITPDNGVVHSSKFFAPPPDLHVLDDDKENLEELEEIDVASAMEAEMDEVKQDDGYISPGPAFSSPDCRRGITPDFSSPLQVRSLDPRRAEEYHETPRKGGKDVTPNRSEIVQDDIHDDGSSDGRITSPPSGSRKTPAISMRRSTSKVTLITMRDLEPHLKPRGGNDDDVFVGDRLSVDLRGVFSESPRSKLASAVPIEELGKICEVAGGNADAQSENERIEDEDEMEDVRQAERHRIVGAGWEKRYASTSRGRSRPGKGKADPHPVLGRRETMSMSLLQEVSRPPAHSKAAKPRRSDPVGAMSPQWIAPVRTRATQGVEEDEGAMDDDNAAETSSQGAVVDDPGTASTASRARLRLHAFRFR